MRELSLIVLTESYPYGSGETFFEHELNALSNRFKSITIMPNSGSKEKREMPANVKLDNALIKNRFTIWIEIIRSFFGLSHLRFFLKRVNVGKEKFNLIRSYKYYLGLLSEAKAISKYLDTYDKKDFILYAYWMKHSALSLAFMNGDSKKIVRGHGSDIYELNYYHPFHKFISQKVHMIITVSKYGKEYLQDQYKISREKVHVAYLGIQKFFTKELPYKEPVERYEMVSCGNCIPLKRIDQIILATQLIAKKNPDRLYRLTHFGDGPLFKELSVIAKRSPHNLIVDMKGRVENISIQKFYSENYIHGFINFSTTEGIPVSIMEAMAYGIPVVAANVGGISEMINHSNGILVSFQITTEELAEIISDVFLVKKFDRSKIKVLWAEKFNSHNQVESLLEHLNRLV